LRDSNCQMTPTLRLFFESFGVDQVCAMCLAVACNNPCVVTKSTAAYSSRRQSFASSSPNIASGAKQLFFEHGGRPTPKEQFQTHDGLSAHSNSMLGGTLGLSVSIPEFNYSGRHNGLALYLGRLLKPIWKEKISKRLNHKDGGKVLDSTINPDSLIYVKNNLESLDDFLNQNKYFTAIPTPETDLARYNQAARNRAEEDAQRAEQQSLYNIHCLLQQSIESIQFVLLLIDHNLDNILQGLPAPTDKEFEELTFENLVITENGRRLAKTVITVIINNQVDNQVSVDTISEMLRQKCPTFCSPTDVMLYKGIESLQRSKCVQSDRERDEYLAESLRLFSLVADSIQFSKLEEIVASYKSLKYYPGAIQLVLLHVKKLDVANLALIFYKNRGGNDIRAEDLYSKRKSCYELIFGVISAADSATNDESSRRQVYDIVVNSDDELFHYCLYDWFLTIEAKDRLIHMKSDYIEQFLVSQKDNIEIAELLSAYYSQNQIFDKSAKVLSDLANSSDESLTLDKRMEYLSRAIAAAKSSRPGAHMEYGHILHDLEESNEVADIQRNILMMIRNNPNVESRIVKHLDDRLLDISELYNNYAAPYGLDEIILSIFHTSGHKDRQLIESTWKSLIGKVCDRVDGRSKFGALDELVHRIGVRFYPDENAFPTAFLCNYLESISFESQGPSDGWVINTMCRIGVPFNVLFHHYHSIFEAKQTPWQQINAISYLLQEICMLLNRWLATEKDPSVFPVKDVDEAISKYLVTKIPNDTMGTSSNLQTIQTRLRRRFS